ncbi:MAG: YidH family protein [Desulfovibrionales bacterium]
MSKAKKGQKPNSAEHRTDLAQERTDWAMDRTMMAKQRTFSAWVRTGLAALAVGFAGTRLLGELEPNWLIRVAGGSLILVSGLIFLLGYFGYRKTFRKLKEAGMVSHRGWIVGLISAVLVFASAAGMAFIFLN